MIKLPVADRTIRISPPVQEREQSRGEEIANSISHGIGLLAALVATPPLIMQAARQGSAGYIFGVTLFAGTMVLLYLASTLYHALPAGKAKRVFKVIEHSAIFLLISGTYTPFTLGALRGVWGWTLLALVWTFAAAGVALKVSNRGCHPFLSTSLYLALGWLVVIVINPLREHVAANGVFWLFAGGVAYTAGVAFFAADCRLRYAHFIWHLFVMAGTGCHYYAVLRYAA